MSPLKSIIYIVGGLAAIIIGGDLVVDSACDIAAAFGMSEALIGLTIVAAGTSLPELVTSIVAAKKGDSGLALGNVVGSNIFNMLSIIGVSALIKPIVYNVSYNIDMIFVILGTQDKAFVRLVKEIEELKKDGIIKEKVVIQSGVTKYESDEIEMIDYLPIFPLYPYSNKKVNNEQE